MRPLQLRRGPSTDIAQSKRYARRSAHAGVTMDNYSRCVGPAIDEISDDARVIIFGEDARAPVQDVNWLLREGNVDQSGRVVVLRVNNVYGIFRAVESGLGIASLPDYLARESTKIEMVLPDLNVRTTDVYFTYPEELRHSKRIAVFRDFLLRKVAETRF